MRNVRKAYTIAFCALWLSFRGPGYVWADEPLNMSVTQANSVSVEAFGFAPIHQLSQIPISLSSQGSETSQCQKYGRASDAIGNSNVDVVRHSENWITLTLNSYGQTHGGHFRTCDTCVLNVCVGVHGNDTAGTSSVSAGALITLAFDSAYQHPIDYLLSVSIAGVPPIVSLVDGAGQPLSTTGKDGGPAPLLGAPGKTYYLKLSLPIVSKNVGGCCEDIKAASSTIDVRLSRAPILASASLVGFIFGGTPTKGYRNVGALLKNGKLHCSGTVISSNTVLTAAHCLVGIEAKDLKFILGSDYKHPENQIYYTVDTLVYPNGKVNDFNLMFNEKTLENDVGLLIVKEKFQAKPVAFYQAPPSWDQIREQGMSLIFVGFGFNVIDGDPVAPGIKREGTWQIDQLDDRRVYFLVPGKSTCEGDSGGPAFIDKGTELQLVAITSGSVSDTCKDRGVETRVDAYMQWITANMRK